MQGSATASNSQSALNRQGTWAQTSTMGKRVSANSSLGGPAGVSLEAFFSIQIKSLQKIGKHETLHFKTS